MSLGVVIFAIAVAAAMSLFFSTLTYALRDFSRARLETSLDRRGKLEYLEPTVDHASDLIFVTAVGRLFSNILVLIGVLHVVEQVTPYRLGIVYLIAVAATALIHLFCSVAIPHAISRHAAEPTIGLCIRFLHGLRLAAWPIIKVMHVVDSLVSTAATRTAAQQPEQLEEEIENEILSAVEEGEKEGVVDEKEREMIERVIAFHDTTVGQIMTPRPEIFAIEFGASLEAVKATIAKSGHSRIPVYQGSIDKVVGVLHTRDLLKFLGLPPERFNVKEFIRPAIFVPETKPLPDLLRDFRLQKIHIAIVGDEYGGTAGLVTIEDLFEELVGDVSDEHEPSEPAMIQRIDDLTAEADARTYLDELNRVLGLNLPEDAGYDTLGGFVTTTAGKIPPTGATFEHAGVKYTILDAEPQKVNRVKIEMSPVIEPETASTTQATQ